MIEIYIDENLSEYVADALNSLNKGPGPLNKNKVWERATR